VNDDELDRQFEELTGSIHSNVLVDRWNVSEASDDRRACRDQPRGLGALRFILAVSTIPTLLAGWWIEAAGGPIGDWAMSSPFVYWLAWVLLMIPLVALAVAALAAQFLDVGIDG